MPDPGSRKKIIQGNRGKNNQQISERKVKAKRSEIMGHFVYLEHAKSKRNGSLSALLRFETKKIFIKRIWRTQIMGTLGSPVFPLSYFSKIKLYLCSLFSSLARQMSLQRMMLVM
jgi:hypothetical protein